MSMRDSKIGSPAPGASGRWRGGAARVGVLAAAALACVLPGCKKGARASAQAPAVVTAPPPSGKHSLIKNASFKDGSSLPWLTSFSSPAKGTTDVHDGALCLTLDDKGKNAWDAQLVQRP